MSREFSTAWQADVQTLKKRWYSFTYMEDFDVPAMSHADTQ